MSWSCLAKRKKVMDVTLAVTSRAKNSNYNIAKQNEKPEQIFLFLLEFSTGIWNKKYDCPSWGTFSLFS